MCEDAFGEQERVASEKGRIVSFKGAGKGVVKVQNYIAYLSVRRKKKERVSVEDMNQRRIRGEKRINSLPGPLPGGRLVSRPVGLVGLQNEGDEMTRSARWI